MMRTALASASMIGVSLLFSLCMAESNSVAQVMRKDDPVIGSSLENRKNLRLLSQQNIQLTPIPAGVPAKADNYPPLDYDPEVTDKAPQVDAEKRRSEQNKKDTRSAPGVPIPRPSVEPSSSLDSGSNKKPDMHSGESQFPQSTQLNPTQSKHLQKKSNELLNRDTLDKSLNESGVNKKTTIGKGRAGTQPPFVRQGAENFPVGPPGRSYYPPHGTIPYPNNSYVVPGGRK